MTLFNDAELREVRTTAKRFFRDLAPISAFRHLRDRRDGIGYSREAWQEMVKLGFTAASISEADGGLGLGYSTLGCILEEGGRTLYASPLVATVVAGASVVELAGSSAQRAACLPAVALGERTLTLALQEQNRHNPATILTTATKRSDRYVLTGRKVYVLDGCSADELIVVARTSGSAASTRGISLFLVPRNADGIRCTPLHMADSRSAADVVLESVEVAEGALLGVADEAFTVIERVLDRACLCLAAEMLGGILELFERTVAYLKEREQFGVKIGSFQALKHRAAKMFTEIEMTRSVVWAGLSALDENSADTSLLASLAKARANDTFRLVSNEAVQMHGGIGVTDELDVGLFLKRSRVATQCFGDTRYHRDRFATLSGF